MHELIEKSLGRSFLRSLALAGAFAFIAPLSARAESPAGKAGNEMEPGRLPRHCQQGAAPAPRPAAVGDLDPDGVVRCLDRDRVQERALAECLAEGRGRLAARPLALLVRAEPVEDQREHGLRSVFRPGCRPPQGAGELEEVTGVGVRADGAVAFARVE